MLILMFVFIWSRNGLISEVLFELTYPFQIAGGDNGVKRMKNDKGHSLFSNGSIKSKKKVVPQQHYFC